MSMTTPLILLVLLGAAVLIWSAASVAAEIARAEAQLACQRAGVQLLDQTVMLRAIKLRRDEQGRLRLWRHYSFDYSIDGISRIRGDLALLAGRLQWISEIGAGMRD